MRTSLLSLGALSLGLASCGPGEPVILPDDIQQAARLCFAAQSLVLRADASKGDPVTFAQYSEAIQFPLMAAAQMEPFKVENAMGAMKDVEGAIDQVSSLDYEGAIATCEARFGIAGKEGEPALPENEQEALLGCLGMGSFMAGSVQEEGESFKEKVGVYEALNARLQAKMEKDPVILARMIKGETEAMINDALKSAFSEGDPEGYLDKCLAKYPAG